MQLYFFVKTVEISCSVAEWRARQQAWLELGQIVVTGAVGVRVDEFVSLVLCVGTHPATRVTAKVVDCAQTQVRLSLDAGALMLLRDLGVEAARVRRTARVGANEGDVVEVPLLEPGALIEGRFRIESHLSTGGMGDVYRATHVHLNRPVALKLLRQHFVGDSEMWLRFEREAQLISQLESPHIVRVFDFGKSASGQPFLALEFVEGTTFDGLLSGGPLDPCRVVELIAQVCTGLTEAHQAGVIHRDLKPANLVLGKRRDGGLVAKILDFGIAMGPTSSGEGRVTRTGAVLGTPLYLAPEQAMGDVIDQRTDLYALACVTFELLTGRPPFLAPELATIIGMHIAQPPPALPMIRPELSHLPALCAVVTRGLSKAKADRYQTSEAFAVALRKSLEVLAPAALTVPGSPRHPEGLKARSPHRRVMDSQQLVVGRQVLDEWALAREGFSQSGERLVMVTLEVGEAPERAWALSEAVVTVQRYGGVVDMVGDGRATLLLSGTTTELASRAVMALLAADDVVRSAHARPAPLRGVALQVGGGIDLSAPLSPNWLSRAQQLLDRRPGAWVGVDRQLADEASDLVEIEELDHEVSRLVARRSLLRPVAGLIVGRERAVELLCERVKRLPAGRVAPLVFRGPPGSGRTATLFELAKSARALGVQVATGGQSLLGQPYGALVDVLWSLLGQAPGSTIQLLAALRASGVDGPTLATVSLIVGGAPFSSALTAGQCVLALRQVRALVHRESPTVLLIDDLESLDAESLEVVLEAMRAPAPGELVVTFCGFELTSRLDGLETIELTPLTRGDVAKVLASRLASVPTAQVTDRLFSLTSGLPGRLTDWLQLLDDRGSLRSRAGWTTIVGACSPLDPDALARARLEATQASMRRMLEALSRCGPSFDLPLAAAAVPGVTEAHLQWLHGKGWLRRLGDGVWAFASARVVQALEPSAQARVDVHERLAHALLRRARSAPSQTNSLRLASHLNAARLGTNAIPLWRHLEAQATEQGLWRDVIVSVRGRADALGQGSQNDSVVRERVELLAQAANIACTLSEPGLARGLVDEGLEVQGSLRPLSALLEFALARVLRSEARPARALEALERARLSATPALHALLDAERAEGFEQGGDLLGALLEWERARLQAEAATTIGATIADVLPLARVEARLGGLALMMKDEERARTLFDDALRRAEGKASLLEAKVLANWASLELVSHRSTQALEALTRGASLARQGGDLLLEVRLLLNRLRVAARTPGPTLPRLANEVIEKARQVGWVEGEDEAGRLSRPRTSQPVEPSRPTHGAARAAELTTPV